MGMDERIKGIYGADTQISRAVPVSGGDINEASCLELSNGEKLFIKRNRPELLSIFEAEKLGLQAMAATGAIRVPEVIDCGMSDGRAYLLMKYIAGGRRKSSFWEDFGHRLADMHSADTSGLIDGRFRAAANASAPAVKAEPSGSLPAVGKRFGFVSDNFIGARPQDNTACDSWVDFFRDRRLMPQLRAADRYFDAAMRRRIDALMAGLDDLLVEPKAPALIHGDLWSGNFITGDDGDAWLIDPAVYVGHPEADIAMTELFGGFDRRFYDAYKESGLLQPGYEKRRDLYNLYHMLNHLNMFGPGYYPSVEAIVRRYV